MSIDILGPVFYLPLESHQKLVLAVLADNANDSGHCWPSQNTIALKASLSERRVRDHLKLLELEHWITVLQRGDGRGKTTHYLLNIAMIQDRASKVKEALKREKADKADTQKQKADTLAGKADTSEPPNRQEPSLEPLPPLVPPKGGKSKRGKHEITEDETAEVLALFQGRSLDIPIEIASWRAWCQEKGQMATRRRLIAWLSRAGPKEPVYAPQGVEVAY